MDWLTTITFDMVLMSAITCLMVREVLIVALPDRIAGPGGSFIDGRKQLTLGVSFGYLSEWLIDLSYTDYSGAGMYNALKDRDFFAASVSYSF